jgi:hypothetical protein
MNTTIIPEKTRGAVAFLDSVPNLAEVGEQMAHRHLNVEAVLSTFSQLDLCKLTLVLQLTNRDLALEPDRLRELLWIELRAAMIDDPTVLKQTLGGDASDPDQPDNRRLVERLKGLSSLDVRALAWLVAFITETDLVDNLLKGVSDKKSKRLISDAVNAGLARAFQCGDTTL